MSVGSLHVNGFGPMRRPVKIPGMTFLLIGWICQRAPGLVVGLGVNVDFIPGPKFSPYSLSHTL